MTRKVYRTAQGRMVDLGALQLQNENVRAVGNMGVNARGDLIDNKNKPIKTRNQQVAKQYNKQTSNVSDAPVYSSAKTAKTKKPVVNVPPPPEDFDDDFIRDPVAPKATTAAPPTEGLAAAIARARQIKQDPGTQEAQ